MKKTILAIACCAILALTGCKGAEESEEITLFEASENVLTYEEQAQTTTLSILNGIGEVNIYPSENENIKIIVDAEYSGASEEDYENKLNALADMNPEILGETLYLEPLAKQESEKNYFSYIEENLNADNIKLNYNIYVPENITKINAINPVGGIFAQDLKGEFSLYTNTGNISGESLALINNSDFEVATGNITCYLSDIKDANKITAEVGMGNLVFSLPPDSTYDVDDTLAQSSDIPSETEVSFSADIIKEYREQLLNANLGDETKYPTTVIGTSVGLGTKNVR